MKRGMIFVLVLLAIGFVGAAPLHSASEFWLNIDGNNMSLQKAYDDGLLAGAHTYSDTTNISNPGHSVADIWVSVGLSNDEMTFLDALSALDYLSGGSTNYNSYNLAYGHKGTDVIFNDGDSLQDKIMSNGLCTPKTCSDLGAECGNQPDGCGGETQDCGSCSGSDQCFGGVCGACEPDSTMTVMCADSASATYPDPEITCQADGYWPEEPAEGWCNSFYYWYYDNDWSNPSSCGGSATRTVQCKQRNFEIVDGSYCSSTTSCIFIGSSYYFPGGFPLYCEGFGTGDCYYEQESVVDDSYCSDMTKPASSKVCSCEWVPLTWSTYKHIDIFAFTPYTCMQGEVASGSYYSCSSLSTITTKAGDRCTTGAISGHVFGFPTYYKFDKQCRFSNC